MKKNKRLDWQRMDVTHPSGQVEFIERAKATKGVYVYIGSWDGESWTPGSASLARPASFVSRRLARLKSIGRRIDALKNAAMEYENAMAVLVPELLRLKAEEGEQ